ncbi:MAG: EAL domain-containing protein [Gammaproteobacteria bacterium]
MHSMDEGLARATPDPGVPVPRRREDRTELDLFYELERQLDAEPRGQAQLARLIRVCARHLEIGYSVLILPTKQIRVSVTHPSWKSADRRALDRVFIRRFLPGLSRRRSPSVLDVARLPPGVTQTGESYQVMLCPLREGNKQVNGVLALAGRVGGRAFGRAEKRFASLIARRAERVIESTYDPLTGLVNRGGFEAHLRDGLESLADEDDAHAVVIFDIDQLQLVNDTFGHRDGDDVLRCFAAELGEALPGDAVASRLSGDNFAVLLQHTSVESAAAFAEDVRRRAQKLRRIRGDKAVQITVSAGVAAYRSDAGGVSGALVAPKVACTAAKEHGRDRVEVYDADNRSIIRRADDIRIVAHLQNALERDGFELVAQPIVPLHEAAGRAYYEILLRMRGDDGEALRPESFMSAAERYQLMPRLDRWVVDRAITLIADRGGDGGRFAINLSGQSLGDDEFLDFVLERIDAGALEPGTLCFEITETAAVANLERARTFIGTLRARGCRFSLDDFGAGLSSFAYLRDFEVDALKIDGSFVRDVNTNRVSEAMVAAITQVARVMGLDTIAEYVASAGVHGKVAELGVDFAQGYHVGEPMPLAEILADVATAPAASSP